MPAGPKILNVLTDDNAPEHVGQVLDSFAAFLNGAVVATSFAAGGLTRVAAELARVPVYPGNPDPVIHIGAGEPGEAAPYAGLHRSEALKILRKDGPVEVLLSQQWIVYVYSGWEHVYRPRLANARGCEPDDVCVPLMGDLRRLRHDVVHHYGVATAEWTGRCEVVSYWFQPGDVIFLDGLKLSEFYTLLPWDKLREPPQG